MHHSAAERKGDVRCDLHSRKEIGYQVHLLHTLLQDELSLLSELDYGEMTVYGTVHVS